jgi:hypothetical protein
MSPRGLGSMSDNMPARPDAEQNHKITLIEPRLDRCPRETRTWDPGVNSKIEAIRSESWTSVVPTEPSLLRGLRTPSDAIRSEPSDKRGDVELPGFQEGGRSDDFQDAVLTYAPPIRQDR